jgi:hypothetical protein
MKVADLELAISKMVTKGSTREDVFDILGSQVSESAFNKAWSKLYAPEKKKKKSDYPRLVETADGDLVPQSDSFENFKYWMDLREIKFSSLFGNLLWTMDDITTTFGEEERLLIVAMFSDSDFRCSKENQIDFIRHLASASSDKWRLELKKTVWDGKDHIKGFYDRLDSQSTDDFEYVAFKKFIHGYVSLALDLPSPDGHSPRSEILVILVGPEGGGKTAICRTLVPDAPVSLLTEGYLKLSRDDTVRTGEVLLWIVSEVDAVLAKHEIGAIKDFITKSISKERKSYARADDTITKVCSFIGSTNESYFLPAGEHHRRFVVIVVGPNLDYSGEGFNVNQMFAQVVAERAAGFENWLSPAEIKLNSIRNKQWTKIDSLAAWVGTLAVGAETEDALWHKYNSFCTDKTMMASAFSTWKNRLKAEGYTHTHDKVSHKTTWSCQVRRAATSLPTLPETSKPIRVDEEVEM